MAVETFKVVDKKVKIEYVLPELLEGQLKGGWHLSKEDAVAAVKPVTKTEEPVVKPKTVKK
jgi:hypothetical protein